MTTTIVILAALLERIRHLDPFSTFIFRPAVVQLKQMIENADEDRNITLEQRNCFSSAMKACYELEDLLELDNLEPASAGFVVVDKISKRSSQNKKDEFISKICKEILAAVGMIQPRNPPVTPSISRPTLVDHTEEIVGREDDKTVLESALTDADSQLTLVSICDVDGTKKTFLARELFQSEKIQQLFKVRAWVRVSDGYQMRDILQEILSGITVTRWARRRDAVYMPPDKLAETIYRSLKEQRYLIVLDDVCSADAWFILRMALPHDGNGSSILITTKMEDVAEQVGSRIHRMRHLSTEEGWSLFRRKLLLNDSGLDSEIAQIGKEIVMRIKDLPSAINLFAGTLVGTPLNELKQVLTQLRDTIPESTVQLFDVLNFCYKKLPLRLRPCLLYLGNFPDDAEVETNTICQLWIAEGLISMEDRKNKEETVMDVAERYIHELDGRSLVTIEQVVSGQRSILSCRIHCQIQGFCRKKGSEDELFEVIHRGHENPQTSSTIRLALYLDKYECTPSHLFGNAHYLRSLLFFNSSQSGNGTIGTREIPNLDQFIRLRVLCLYGIDFEDGKFPKGVEKLRYLRSLSFRECFLEELSSSLSNIFYLQTLDLRIRNECEMTIESDFLDKLERLKFLYFPENYRTHNNKKLRVRGLKELEILENFDTSLCNTVELLKLTSLKQLAITAKGDISEIEDILKFMKLDWKLSCSVSLIIRCFDCYSKKRFSALESVFESSALHALVVEGYLGKLPKFDSKLPWKLTEIVLNGSELAEDPMQTLQQLPDLRILVLEIEAYIGKKIKCSQTGFPQLMCLKLSKLYKLEDWEVEKEAMPKLCTLIIENCTKLDELPGGLQFTSNLRKLEIASMPDKFVDRIQKSDGAEGEDFCKIEHVKQNVKVDGQFLILKERQQGIAPSAGTSTQEEQKGQNQVYGTLVRGVVEEIDLYLN